MNCNLKELQGRITVELTSIEIEMVRGAWQELDCRTEVCRFTKDALNTYKS